MTSVHSAMAEGPLVLFHRPGTAVLERLVPDTGGPVRFRMHPWEGANHHADLVVEGHLESLGPIDNAGKGALKREATTVEGTARQDHVDRIGLALEAIHSSTLEKVVLSSRLSVQIDGLELDTIVRQQALAHPDSFSWLLHHEAVGTWFGSSPEPLVEGRRPRFRTACLAGTRVAQGNGNATPWTDKEQHEQQLVTDAVMAALKSIQCEDIQLGERQTVQYGPLEHLRTFVDFSATGRLEDVMSALHPTPAVGGTPRDMALDFISRHEGHDRAYYTGWVGLEEDDQVQYFVNLRCARLENDIITAFAGGGITAGSDPEAEWRETRSKLRSLLDPIAHWSE